MLFGHPAIAESPYPGCSYVARTDFDFGPRAFKAGEDFDWLELGLNETKAQELWVAGRLLVKQSEAQTPIAEVPVVETKHQKKQRKA